MSRLQFTLDQGGTLSLSWKSLAGDQLPVEQGKVVPRFACSGMSLSTHDLPASPRERPCFFVWQQLELHLEMPRPARGPQGYQLWLLQDCLIQGQADQQRLFLTFSLAQSVGESQLRLTDGDGSLLATLEFEIFPQKLDYRQDYAQMVQELSQLSYQLALRDQRRSFAWLDRANAPGGWEGLLPQMGTRLIQAIERMLRQPATHWEQRKRYLPPAQVRRAVPQTGPIRPGKRLALHASRHYDRGVHLALQHALQQVERQLQESLRKQEDRPKVDPEPLRRLLSQVQRQLRHPAFPSLPATEQGSPVAFPHLPPAYQAVFRLCQDLQWGLTISQSGWMRMGYRDLPQLYESWAALTVVRLIGEVAGWKVGDQGSTASLPSGGLEFLLREDGQQLRGGTQPLAVWHHSERGEQASLWYQRPFGAKASASFTQIPDLTLEVHKAGRQTPFRFFFEIKYQLQAEAGKQWGPPKSGIAQLHRYRDAILSDKQTQAGRTTALKGVGGVLLFPYPAAEADFLAHPLYQRLPQIQIGAIPLTPGPYRQHDLLREQLALWLEAGPDTLQEQMIEYRKE